MNKSAIALAIAAALTASAVAHAETTLYGSARGSFNWVDPDGGDDFWDVRNHSSRLGVRGSEDLGNGLSAIYQYEFGVDLTEGGNLNSNRPRVLGLKGGFGQLSLGTQWTPYYNTAGNLDIFNATFYNFPKAIFRRDNTLYYATPSLGGITAEVMGQFNGAAGEDGLDEWNMNLEYSNGPFNVGAAYLSDEVTNDDTYAVTAAGSFGGFYAAVLYEDGDFLTRSAAGEDSSYIGGVVQYTFGNTAVRGGIGFLDIDADDPEFDDVNSPGDIQDLFDDDVIEWAVGLQHNLSARTRVWVEYQDVENIDDTNPTGFENVSIGMRHDF